VRLHDGSLRSLRVRRKGVSKDEVARVNRNLYRLAGELIKRILGVGNLGVVFLHPALLV
jgi:hypothetical protein